MTNHQNQTQPTNQQSSHTTPPTAQPYHLKPATAADFNDVVKLFAALHAYNATLDAKFVLDERWQEILTEHFTLTHEQTGALWLLAWTDPTPVSDQNGRKDANEQQAVGLLIMEAHQDSPLFRHRRWAELVAMYIEPAHRRGGLAGQMVAHARHWAATHGFDRVQLYVTANNELAKQFYHRCDFRPAQEIWRLDISPVEQTTSPADPSYSAEKQGNDADLLESGHHHLALEIDVDEG